jgi:hypothetical protein
MVLSLNRCTLISKEETLLKEYLIGHRSFRAYMGLGAITNDIIEFREHTLKKEKVIKTIEGYNHVLGMLSEDPETLLVILTDTSHFSNQPGTAKINLN